MSPWEVLAEAAQDDAERPWVEFLRVSVYASASSAPGLDQVLRAVVAIYPNAVGSLEKLSGVAAGIQVPNRCPRQSTAPVAALLFHAIKGWPRNNIPPVPPARLAVYGSLAVDALVELSGEGLDYAGHLVFPLLILLSDERVTPDLPESAQAVLDDRYPHSARTHDMRAGQVERLLAAWTRTPSRLQRRGGARSAPRKGGRGGGASRKRGEVVPGEALINVEKRWLDKHFEPREEVVGRQTTGAGGGSHYLLSAIQRDAGPFTAGLSTAQHVATVLASPAVGMVDGAAVGGDGDRAALATLMAAVFNLVIGDMVPWDDGDLPAAHALQGRMLIAQLDSSAVRTLGLEAQSLTMMPADPEYAPTPSIACRGLQVLSTIEATVLSTQPSDEGEKRLGEILKVHFHGELTSLRSLRQFGAAWMGEMGLEPVEILLLGGPGASGTDSQVAYEHRMARELSLRFSQARRQLAAFLLEQLPSDQRQRLIALRSPLVLMAESDLEEGDLDLLSGVGCGSRHALIPHLGKVLIERVGEGYLNAWTSEERYEMLGALLWLDLVVNYGVRTEDVPDIRHQDVNLASGIILAPAKEKNGVGVRVRLPLARETVEVMRLLATFGSSSKPSAPLLVVAGSALDEERLRRTLAQLDLIPGYRLRSLRQAFTQRLHAAGVREPLRRELLGHDDPLRLQCRTFGSDRPHLEQLRGALDAVRIPLRIGPIP